MTDVCLARLERTKDRVHLEKTADASIRVPAAEPLRVRIEDGLGRKRIAGAQMRASVDVPNRASAVTIPLRDYRSLDVEGDLVFHVIGFPPGRHELRFEVRLELPGDDGLVHQQTARGTVTVVAQ